MLSQLTHVKVQDMRCVLVLSLPLLSEAILEDISLIEEFDDCQSIVQVQIKSTRQVSCAAVVLKKCEASCRKGLYAFKQSRCTELRGKTRNTKCKRVRFRAKDSTRIGLFHKL